LNKTTRTTTTTTRPTTTTTPTANNQVLNLKARKRNRRTAGCQLDVVSQCGAVRQGECRATTQNQVACTRH
jgi:hypothetical protein